MPYIHSWNGIKFKVPLLKYSGYCRAEITRVDFVHPPFVQKRGASPYFPRDKSNSVLAPRHRHFSESVCTHTNLKFLDPSLNTLGAIADTAFSQPLDSLFLCVFADSEAWLVPVCVVSLTVGNYKCNHLTPQTTHFLWFFFSSGYIQSKFQALKV